MRISIPRWFVFLAAMLAGSAWAGLAPQDLIMDAANKTLAKLKQDRALIAKEPTRLYALVNEFVIPHFDFERMAQWVLGKHWRTASADEKQRFIAEFRTLLVRTYATSLQDFMDRKITYLPFRDSLDSDEVTVRSQVEQSGGFPIPITYRLSKKDGAWLVFDVTIDEVSLVSNYRTSFGNEIRQGGVAKLIEKLAVRNQQASVK